MAYPSPLFEPNFNKNNKWQSDVAKGGIEFLHSLMLSDVLTTDNKTDQLNNKMKNNQDSSERPIWDWEDRILFSLPDLRN